jgi:hypothetical protein
MAPMTGIGTPLHPLDVRPSYTRCRRSVDYGHPVALTHGTWAHPRTIIDAICFMFPKRERTVYLLGRQNSSRSTAKSRLKALTEKLQTETHAAAGTTKGKALLKLLRTHLDTLISPPTRGEQRVTDGQPPAPQPERMEFQRVTDSPAIMKAHNGQDKPCTNVAYIDDRQGITHLAMSQSSNKARTASQLTMYILRSHDNRRE